VIFTLVIAAGLTAYYFLVMSSDANREANQQAP
jgi:hypothetical protein